MTKQGDTDFHYENHSMISFCKAVSNLQPIRYTFVEARRSPYDKNNAVV